MWGPLLYLGALMLHDGPGLSYLRHGLLLAVYTEVVKGRTLWHMYTVDDVKNAI